jgi:hypothetical protein
MTVTITGDTCDKDGLYLASGACGHATQRTRLKGDVFPSCHVCGHPVNWTLLREWSSPLDDDEEDP